MAPPVFKSPSTQYDKRSDVRQRMKERLFWFATLPKITQSELGVGPRWAPTLVRSTLRRSEAIPRRAGSTASNSLHLGCSH